MKKLLIMFSLLLLVACSNPVHVTNEADAMIREAKLTDREQALVQMIGEQSFVFELNINNDSVSEIYTTVDYYANGELVNTILEDMRPVTKEEHDHINLLFSVKDDVKQQLWKSAILTDEGNGISEVVVERIHDEEFLSITTANISEDTPLSLNEKKVVASIVKTNENTVTSRVDITTDEEIKQATDYEEVYLISVELK